MNAAQAKDLLARAKAAQDVVSTISPPPEEGMASRGESVLLKSITRDTRGYIERIANQINGTYENGWYDACAVMIRRLIETLLIEAFEHHHIDHLIKNTSGEFLYLQDLITQTLACSKWNLGRNTRKSLPKPKDIGDKSAHSRRFVAHRGDIDAIATDLRIVVQELVYLAGLK